MNKNIIVINVKTISQLKIWKKKKVNFVCTILGIPVVLNYDEAKDGFTKNSQINKICGEPTESCENVLFYFSLGNPFVWSSF